MTTLVGQSRWLPLLFGVTMGLAALLAGVVLLTSWEVELFHATTFDRDFTGLVCGVPLDNPGWETGSPCHGAVNRQTGFGLMLSSVGLVMVTGVIAMAVGQFRPTSRPPAAR